MPPFSANNLSLIQRFLPQFRPSYPESYSFLQKVVTPVQLHRLINWICEYKVNYAASHTARDHQSTVLSVGIAEMHAKCSKSISPLLESLFFNKRHYIIIVTNI